MFRVRLLTLSGPIIAARTGWGPSDAATCLGRALGLGQARGAPSAASIHI